MNKRIVKEIPNNIPFRSTKKLESYLNLMKDIKMEVDEEQSKLNYFNLKNEKKKYQLKTFSYVRWTFQGDIFFSTNNRTAFLLIIDVNTRKAYARQLGEVQVSTYIDVESRKEVIQLSYDSKQRKTTSTLIDAFDYLLKQTKVNILSFDGEPAVHGEEFQTYLKSHDISFKPVIKNHHTSLSILNRMCRTLRDMAFNMKREILTQADMNELLGIYNNVRHETITQILFEKNEDLANTYQYGISPNDMTRELEEIYVQTCVQHNLGILLQSDYNLYPGMKVRIYNLTDKMKKKRSTLSQDIYEVIGHLGTAVELRNTNNGEIEYRTRWQISIIN